MIKSDVLIRIKNKSNYEVGFEVWKCHQIVQLDSAIRSAAGVYRKRNDGQEGDRQHDFSGLGRRLDCTCL